MRRPCCSCTTCIFVECTLILSKQKVTQYLERKARIFVDDDFYQLLIRILIVR